MSDHTSTEVAPTLAEWEAHRAFHRLTVKERDAERVRVDRLTRENAALKATIQQAAGMVKSGNYDTERLLDALSLEGHPNGPVNQA